MPSFKYVKVPADDSQPIVEVTLEYEEDRIVQCLTEKLQDYFRNIGGAVNDKELFKSQVRLAGIELRNALLCCDASRSLKNA